MMNPTPPYRIVYISDRPLPNLFSVVLLTFVQSYLLTAVIAQDSYIHGTIDPLPISACQGIVGELILFFHYLLSRGRGSDI